MKAEIFIALSAAIVVSTVTVNADDEKKQERKIPAHSKEWTDYNSSDPGVNSAMDELASIVVLCATDHQAAEFKRAWSGYLRKHKPDAAETQKLINQVLAKAEQHRQEFGQVKQDRKRSARWKGEARKTLQDASKLSPQ